MSKRKSDMLAEIYDDDLDYELENMPMTDSCDTVRYVSSPLANLITLPEAHAFAFRLPFPH
jgi:hypothetical protein